MRILVVDSDNVGLDFCLRSLDAGHEVKLFIPKDNGERQKTGDGLVPKVPAWEPHVKWADLIVCTQNNKYIHALDSLRKEGFPVFAPSQDGHQLEINRGFGMEVLKKYGIDVPPYKTFNSFDEAEKFLWKSDERWVFKTLGDEADKSLSYCSQSSADLIQQIRNWKKNGKKLKGPCMLQQFIEGVEFGVSGFFGPHGFNSHFSECFEHKKFMSGEIGHNTGEMGSCLKYVKKSKLADEALKPIIPFLKKTGYIGDIDNNCIIDKKGKVWPLEFTARLGYPAFWIMLSQHLGDPAKWMLDLIKGKDTQKVTEDIGTGIVLLAQPKFSIGHPIYGVTPKVMENIHLVEVMAGRAVDNVDGNPKETDMLITAGDYIACITGLGKTVRESAKNAYRTIEQIHVSNALYRDDIGEKLKKMIPELQAHEFATEWEY